MNEHAGPACALSVLIVAIFAILLHDRTLPTPTSIARTPLVPLADRIDHPGKSAVATPNRETPPSPRSPMEKVEEERALVSPTSPAKPLEHTETISPTPTGTRSRVEPNTEFGGSHPEKPTPPRSPKPPFTVVLSGEKLVDVATRVYGSADSTGGLWRANRDQVAQIDSVLAPGTLLRTP